ncbi:MAG: fumarate hydratase, partial [Lachnospiraceae bacterium]|nr:fumarate hydratase [Lachnospiraceae bacterium]
MREIPVSIITDAIEDMCITVCHELSDDMKACLYEAYENETSQIGKKILGQLKENLDIAKSEMIPICQDTGMAVIFLKVGQEVLLTGGDITDAVNEGVRRGYTNGYLRKSVV